VIPEQKHFQDDKPKLMQPGSYPAFPINASILNLPLPNPSPQRDADKLKFKNVEVVIMTGSEMGVGEI
jgi:hypothetical protein